MFRRSLVLSICIFSLELSAQDRVTKAVDPSQVTQVKGNINPKAQARLDLGPADASMEIPYLTIRLKHSDAQQTALDQLLAEQQTPGSANYRKWLTPQAFGERFGLSVNDLAKVTGWLSSQGLTVNDVAAGRQWITFSGTVRQINSALHTSIHLYRSGAETRYANSTEPSVPTALANVVAGFDRLNDFPENSAHIVVPAYNTGGAHYLAPADFATIYDLNKLYQQGIDGTGLKIAIVGRVDINLADIAAFRSQFGLPANPPQVVLYGPDPGSSSTSDLGEADLDLEWSGAVAYNATIIYVNSKSVNTSSQYAVDNNLAPVMSYSYLSCEPGTNTAFRSIAQQAAAQGITWMASSGDSGSTACDPDTNLPQATLGLAVNVPASFPEITGVGGTMFNEGSGAYWNSSNGTNSESALSYIPEIVWNEDNGDYYGIASGGGGASIFFSKPAWQAGPGVPNDGARDVPDVAMTSAIHDGYAVTSDGTGQFFAGTSAASPSFAGIVALLNQYLVKHGTIQTPGLGNINPTLYRLAQSSSGIFHDITSGSNASPCVQESPNCVSGFSTGFSAAAGYDLASGLGSVDGYNLITGWNASGSTTTTLSISPGATDLNGTLSLAAQVKASGSGSITGTVSFNADNVSLGSAQLSSGQTTATLSIAANLLPPGDDTVYAVYSGNANLEGSSGSATVTVSIPASGSVVVASISPNPVFEAPTDAAGYSWFASFTLTELAGVPTTLTGFTFNGSALPLTLFPSTSIPAKGTLTTYLDFPTPYNGTFGFTGVDANGHTWSQQVSVTFKGPGEVNPTMIITSPVSAVQKNPNSTSCPWPVPLFLTEHSGFPVNLNSMSLGSTGSTDLTSQLQNTFGATTLAAWGSLSGTLCLTGISAPSVTLISIGGETVIDGYSVSAGIDVTFSATPLSNLPPPTVSPSGITFAAAGASGISASIDLSFGTNAPAWTASVVPPGRVSNWLQVSPSSGTGAATLKVTASASGLSPGGYMATIVISVANGNPPFITVPVGFTVGSSGSVQIGGLSNTFSGLQAYAPGMLTSLYGSGLAPDQQSAQYLPLPISLEGVSVTVNGVTAPLYVVLGSQINFQIPYETGAGPALVTVNNNGKVASYAIIVSETAPGLWPYFLNLSGVITSSAKNGDTLITFLTGEGAVTPVLADGATPSGSTSIADLPHAQLPITVTVGGFPATVQFYGIPSGFAGVSQLNLTLPTNLPVGPQQVVVSIGGVAAQTLTLQITQ